MDNSAKITVRAGSFVGSEIKIGANLITIGRDPAVDFVLDDSEVSRSHAKIYYEDGSYFIEDLDSTNGTFVNGKCIKKPLQLKDKDLITIGEKNVIEFNQQEIEQVETDFPATLADEEVQSEEKKQVSHRISDREKKASDKLENEKSDGKGKFGFLSRFPTWAIVLLIAVGFLIVFCLIPFVIIEVTDQWCNLFSGFFNAISPGVCP